MMFIAAAITSVVVGLLLHIFIKMCPSAPAPRVPRRMPQHAPHCYRKP